MLRLLTIWLLRFKCQYTIRNFLFDNKQHESQKSSEILKSDSEVKSTRIFEPKKPHLKQKFAYREREKASNQEYATPLYFKRGVSIDRFVCLFFVYLFMSITI